MKKQPRVFTHVKPMKKKLLCAIIALLCTILFIFCACAPANGTDAPRPLPVTYSPDRTLADVSLPQGWRWAAPDETPTVGKSLYPAVHTEDGMLYNITLTVNKATPEIYEPPAADAEKTDFGEELPPLTGGRASVRGKFAYSDGSERLSHEKCDYLWTFTPDDAVNYESVEGNIRLLFDGDAAALAAKKINDAVATEGYSAPANSLFKHLSEQYFKNTEKIKTPAALDRELDAFFNIYDKVALSAEAGSTRAECDLKGNATYKNYKLGFKARAENADLYCFFNGERLNETLSEFGEHHYNALLKEGKNRVSLYAVDGGGLVSVNDYTLICDSKEINVYFAAEAFTINGGYVCKPVQVTLNDALFANMADKFEGIDNIAEMRAAFNGAYLCEYLLAEAGYTTRYTGTLSDSYYLASVGFPYTAVPDDKLLDCLKADADVTFDLSTQTGGHLGEFCYTNLSGWLYSVNGTFPTIGLSGYFPQDGDIIRLQFSLNMGKDIGEDSGWTESYFDVADRDALTGLCAKIAAERPDISTKEAIEAMQDLFVTEERLSEIYKRLLEQTK